MRVIGWMFAVLLLLFGGGCTIVALLFVVDGMGSTALPIWMIGGLLPLLVGTVIVWALKANSGSSGPDGTLQHKSDTSFQTGAGKEDSDLNGDRK